MISSYIDKLSRSLYVEYKLSGIDVQCQVWHSFILQLTTYFLVHNRGGFGSEYKGLAMGPIR